MDNTQYIPPNETYPMWEKAVEKVRERFEAESYGFIVKHKDLKETMGIIPSKTINEVQKEQLDYLGGMEKVKIALLEDYNLCLHSVPGQGYKLLHPNDQVRKGADYYIKKSQRSLARTMHTLANVDVELLDTESRALQLAKMSRVAFIKAAFRKRRIPMAIETKQIESKDSK